MSQSDPKSDAKCLLEYLRRLKNDRGAMADLRCALDPARRARAWPLLGSIPGIGNGIGNRRIEIVSGLFAYHQNETDAGNLGTTCQRLAAENNTFDGRFRRLLTCDREEICNRLRPVVLAAKAKGLPVNYEELFADLCYWSEKVKVRWAREFWGTIDHPVPTTVSSSEAVS